MTTAVAGVPPGISRSQWRVIILSSLGGALEFYDFVVYAYFAVYIGRTFFPVAGPTSPPRARPCSSRQTTTMIGAAMPIVA